MRRVSVTRALHRPRVLLHSPHPSRMPITLRHAAATTACVTTTATAATLDTKDFEFLRHLPDIAPPHTPLTPGTGGSGHGADTHLHEHDWGVLATTLALTPPKSSSSVTSACVSDATPIDCGGYLLQTPVPKRNSWTRRLVVTKQPASEFYKDEGGKSNALDVEVTLVEFNELGEPARSPDDDFVDIPLRILLFFESGKRVDDTDQEIFRFVGNEYDSIVIRAAARKAAVQFRLEKVSRRKDGQRFKLRIEVDQEQCTANVADLTPIFTNAICVLSKRKHHSHATESAARAREPPLKLLKRDLNKIEEKIDERMEALLDEITRMNRQIQLQNEMIAKMLMPITSTSASVSVPLTNETATVEWFLKSGLMDDVLCKTAQLPAPTTAMPYFSMSDDSDDRLTHSSPASSESSMVEIPSSSPSTVTFAEF